MASLRPLLKLKPLQNAYHKGLEKKTEKPVKVRFTETESMTIRTVCLNTLCGYPQHRFISVSVASQRCTVSRDLSATFKQTSHSPNTQIRTLIWGLCLVTVTRTLDPKLITRTLDPKLITLPHGPNLNNPKYLNSEP